MISETGFYPDTCCRKKNSSGYCSKTQIPFFFSPKNLCKFPIVVVVPDSTKWLLRLDERLKGATEHEETSIHLHLLFLRESLLSPRHLLWLSAKFLNKMPRCRIRPQASGPGPGLAPLLSGARPLDNRDTRPAQTRTYGCRLFCQQNFHMSVG